MAQENKLQIIVQQSGLEETKANYMLENFKSYFEIASEWEAKAKTLTVTNEEDVVTMKMAKEGRLFLRQKRIDVENARKKLKEQSLREGRAIDGIANVLKSIIVPIEEYLDKQEKYAEIKQAERRKALQEERETNLLPFGTDISLYNLGDMDGATFDALYELEKAKYDSRIAAEKKAEEERIAKEKAEREEQERIRKENERLRKEAEEREKQLAAERAAAEKLRKEAEEKARVEQAKAAKKLAEEKAAREKVEAELRAKREAEEKAIREKEQEENARKKAEEIEAQRAAAAPDMEKLARYVAMINGLVKLDIGLTTPTAKTALNKAKENLQKVADQLSMDRIKI